MNLFSKYELFGSDKEYADNWHILLRVLNDLKIKSMLSVGLGNINGSDARKWNYFLTNECKTIETVINLEIDLNFCNNVKKSSDKLINNIIHGDVRTFDSSGLNVDLIFWSHGPEHIFRHEWKDTFKKLEDISNKIIILQMPWGSGYDYMSEHTCKSIKKGEIESYGYYCYYQGVENTLNASLAGFKIK